MSSQDGRGLALLWPSYLRVILPKKEAKIARLGTALWDVPAGASAAEKTITALEAWLKAHGFTQRLKDIGVTEAMIPLMAADTIRLNGGGRTFLDSPVPLTVDKVEALYRAAF